MPAYNATVATCIASLFAVAPLRATFWGFVRSAGMANSSFGALAILMLAVAVAVFLLTPHERPSSLSFNSPAFWSSQ